MSTQHSLKQYIIEEFIPDGHLGQLADDLDLIQNGILDSLAVLKLVAFIEDQYDIALEPTEISPEHLNTISAMNALVARKRQTNATAF